MAKYSPQDRMDWILEYAFNNSDTAIGVNNEDFVLSYLHKFELKAVHSPTGIPRCQQLARDLSYLLDIGDLVRDTLVHSKEEVDEGFTRWTYIYYLSEWAYEELSERFEECM